MLMHRKVMKAACMNMSWSEARCEESFTVFIVGSLRRPGQCTDGGFIVE